MVETMAKNTAEEVPVGVIAQEMWEVIMDLDKDGRRLVKDEAKNKRQREREKKKKATAKAKKRAKREQKRRKQESRKKSRREETDSSDESSSTPAAPQVPNRRATPHTNPSSDKGWKSKSRDGGGRNGTLKPRRGCREDFEFRWINCRKDFHTNKGTS